MLSYGVLIFTTALIGVVVASLILSLHLSLGEPLSQVYRHFRFKTIEITVIVLIATNIVNLAAYFQSSQLFTQFIHSLEGSSVVLLQNFTHPLATAFFVFSYLVIYPVIIILTYFKLHSIAEEIGIKYTTSYILLLLFSAPIFYIFPVEVTGYYLEEMQPLLYSYHPYIQEGLTSFDPLTKALPSLHTGITVLAALYSYNYTENYRWPVLFFGSSVILSTFYLGVHWITDAVIGALLAALSYYLVDREFVTHNHFPQTIIDWRMKFLNRIRSQ
jgi:membrane-associated phospholipid phosphatase